jgi:hypothetical protein
MEPPMNCCRKPGAQVRDLRCAPAQDASCGPRPASARPRRTQTAFSLLEVMIACGIFFMCIFSILAMVSSVLRNARSLRRTELDAGVVAAQISLTNKLYEGVESGDWGKIYPGCSWEAQILEVATNGLFQVDIVVHRRGVQQPVDKMSIWLFRPESPNPR